MKVLSTFSRLGVVMSIVSTATQLSCVDMGPTTDLMRRYGEFAQCTRNSGPSSNRIRSLILGQGYSCALKVSGRVTCAGRNSSGILGRLDVNELASVHRGVDVGLSNVEQLIRVGPSSACARDSAGRVFCWGSNQLGVLGVGHTADDQCSTGPCRRSPALVAGIPRVSRLVAGYLGLVAVGIDGSVWRWGIFVGQDGNMIREIAFPQQLAYERVTDVDVVLSRVAAYRSDGSLVDDDVVGVRRPTLNSEVFAGALGQVCLLHGLMRSVQCRRITPATQGFPNPVRVDCVTEVSQGSEHTCVVTGRGSVECWGVNDFGECGALPTTSSRCEDASLPEGWCVMQPNSIRVTVPFERVFVGPYQTCAVDEMNRVWCWGAVNGTVTHVPIEVTI